MTDIKDVERTWLRPSLDEMYDLQWSPDGTLLIACSIDSKVSFPVIQREIIVNARRPNQAEILRIASRDSLLLTGHTSYVQGVAWDPLNQMVVTQSADRSMKVHQV